MKRMLCSLICLVSLVSFGGCHADDAVPLVSGTYYAVGDYEELMTPYLWLDTDDRRFSFGAGAIYSYAENGTYEVVDGMLIATSPGMTFRFEIRDKDTVVLIDNADDPFKIPVDTPFVYSDELK